MGCNSSHEAAVLVEHHSSLLGRCWETTHASGEKIEAKWFPYSDNDNGQRPNYAFTLAQQRVAPAENNPFLQKHNLVVYRGVDVKVHNSTAVDSISSDTILQTTERGFGGNVAVAGTMISLGAEYSRVRSAGPGRRSTFTIVMVKVFELEIVPSQHKERAYTQHEVDTDVVKRSARDQFGEGVITQVLYGGYLVIDTAQENFAAMRDGIAARAHVGVSPAGGGEVGGRFAKSKTEGAKSTNFSIRRVGGDGKLMPSNFTNAPIEKVLTHVDAWMKDLVKHPGKAVPISMFLQTYPGIIRHVRRVHRNVLDEAKDEVDQRLHTQPLPPPHVAPYNKFVVAPPPQQQQQQQQQHVRSATATQAVLPTPPPTPLGHDPTTLFAATAPQLQGLDTRQQQQPGGDAGTNSAVTGQQAGPPPPLGYVSPFVVTNGASPSDPHGAYSILAPHDRSPSVHSPPFVQDTPHPTPLLPPHVAAPPLGGTKEPMSEWLQAVGTPPPPSQQLSSPDMPPPNRPHASDDGLQAPAPSAATQHSLFSDDDDGRSGSESQGMPTFIPTKEQGEGTTTRAEQSISLNGSTMVTDDQPHGGGRGRVGMRVVSPPLSDELMTFAKASSDAGDGTPDMSLADIRLQRSPPSPLELSSAQAQPQSLSGTAGAGEVSTASSDGGSENTANAAHRRRHMMMHPSSSISQRLEDNDAIWRITKMELNASKRELDEVHAVSEELQKSSDHLDNVLRVMHYAFLPDVDSDNLDSMIDYLELFLNDPASLPEQEKDLGPVSWLPCAAVLLQHPTSRIDRLGIHADLVDEDAEVLAGFLRGARGVVCRTCRELNLANNQLHSAGAAAVLAACLECASDTANATMQTSAECQAGGPQLGTTTTVNLEGNFLHPSFGKPVAAYLQAMATIDGCGGLDGGGGGGNTGSPKMQKKGGGKGQSCLLRVLVD